MKWGKIRKDTKRTKKYLESLPFIYVVGRWAKFGVREYRFSGKSDEYGVPLVWMYNDDNGTNSYWMLVSVYGTTTGDIWCWTDSVHLAHLIVDSLNAWDKSLLYYKGHHAFLWYDAEKNSIRGRVEGNEHLTFCAPTCEDAVVAFHDVIDNAPGHEVEVFVGADRVLCTRKILTE